MQLRSRARLRSQVCATELIVMPHDGRPSRLRITPGQVTSWDYRPW